MGKMSRNKGKIGEREVAELLRANGSFVHFVHQCTLMAWHRWRERSRFFTGIAGALASEPGMKQQTYVAFTAKDYGADGVRFSPMAVRRLTPVECEALQGFPKNYTLIPWRGGMSPDGARYKALGNSMAVPCMRWLGERIQMVEALT